jgi:hypothetical protein
MQRPRLLGTLLGVELLLFHGAAKRGNGLLELTDLEQVLGYRALHGLVAPEMLAVQPVTHRLDGLSQVGILSLHVIATQVLRQLLLRLGQESFLANVCARY